jgi:hypothetical protein
MKIFINGAETQDVPFQGGTLEEVLHAILNSRKDSYIRRVWLDGKEASSNTQDTLKTSTASVESLELELALLQDLVANNLTNAKEYLEKLVPGFQKAADLFRMGNEQAANQYYLQILEGIDWFSQVLLTIVNAQADIFKEQTLEEREKKLTEFMAQMLEANQNQDWVLMADLLEYEMAPFYKDWQEVLSQIET